MNTETHLISQFKQFYQALHQSDLTKLQNIYAETVVFKDPIHEVRGLVNLEDYLHHACSGVSECRFEYLDQLTTGDTAYIKWIMHFKHPKLGKGLISVRGVSHLQISEKIDFHEDFYDMGAMLYDQLPLLSRVTRWLRTRLASPEQ